MAVLYDVAKFPNNPELVRKVATAAESLYEKLAALDVKRLDVSDYNAEYLRRYQRKLRTHLQKFGYVLAWGLSQSDKPLPDTVLLEYGGGAGILSLLARECGVGTVIYNDVYDVSCVDAETIGQATGNTADHYVCGEIDEITEFLKRRSLSCDVMVSSDVIEHIYDVDEFFSKLPGLSAERIGVAMSSHANPSNPIVKRLLVKKQMRVEYEDRGYAAGHKKRDSLRSYLSIRRDIVRECGDGSLSDGEIEELARATRGMVDADIRSAVFSYLGTKQLPAPPTHRTNTCDPTTGNWEDRLADPLQLLRGLSSAGFDANILAGRYGRPNGLVRRVLARVLDVLITSAGGQGLRLAPFFLIRGWAHGSLRREPAVARTPSDKTEESLEPSGSPR